MREERVLTDVTVVGGGLAGVCAAIAAARLGQKVALVQNRPVLGGNASSEVRVWVCGATGHGVNRYARETGIMGELFTENQYRNPEGNPYLWDLTVLEAVKAEPNIQLYLNTDVHEVEAYGDEDNRQIHTVTGWMMGSERRITFVSKVYLDCTGDGLVGFLAGAKYRLGREAQHEYNESWAPAEADDITLGSTLLFYTKDTGEKVSFKPPSFAINLAETSIPLKRVIRSGDNGCAYWWIEWGGEHDTVHDNERIRDELWAVIYGIWDYIKNSGQFPDSETMTLEWVGSVPGKREYRRFVGDYVLNQNDILAQQEFEDQVAFGGWSIDLHPPQGVYATESGSKHLHSDGVYQIPFRSLYSVNVSNLLFAGRNISATHVAFGTTRVMATCAVIGEAAGTGAALAAKLGVTPRVIYQEYLEELQQTLLRQDASIVSLRNRDERDEARRAAVSASSTLRKLAVETAANAYPLSHDVGLLIPISPELEQLELLVDAAADTVLEVELWSTGRAENYIPHRLEVKSSAKVAAGRRQWVPVPLNWKPAASAESGMNAFVIVRANDSLALYTSEQPLTGVLSFHKMDEPKVSSALEDHDIKQPVIQWSMRGLVRKPFCFRAFPETDIYQAEQVINGYVRPYGAPHLWVSEPMTEGREESLELRWPTASPVTIREIHLTLNDDVNEDLINLHHHRTPYEVMPEVLRSYRLEAETAPGQWQLLHREEENRKRKRVHKLAAPVTAAKLRIVAESTNGSACAEVIEVRVY